jgi:hypothetical protein
MLASPTVQEGTPQHGRNSEQPALSELTEPTDRMTSTQNTADPTTDYDLAALPPPRRPFRRLTFALMAFTALFALWLALGLRGELVYALKGGTPHDIGELSRLRPDSLEAQTWVRAEGGLSSTHVVRYARPLERGAYRLAPVEGNPALWVELRVPTEMDNEHFLAPASFVGRLVPTRAAGLRYDALKEAAAQAGYPLPRDAWLLIDGESPAGTRWVLGVQALLVGFAAFNLAGILRLARPVRDG